MTERADRHQFAAARLWAVHRFPYLASAVFAVSLHEIDDLGGLQVDESWRLYADPALVSAWPVDALGGELLHLTAHLLRDHAARARPLGLGDAAELEHWIDAADAEIGDDFPGDLPRARPVVTAEMLGERDGRLAEHYYLRGHPRRQGVESVEELHDCGSGAHGHHHRWELPPPSTGNQGAASAGGLVREEQDLIRQQVVHAILADAQAPDSLRRWADSWRRPTVDWRSELAAELRRGVSVARGAVDYTYRRPSRRAAALAQQGHGSVVLASLRDPAIEVAIVCDTSASVSDALLGAALAEVDGLVHSTGVNRATVVACDHAVRATERIRRSEDIVLLGGGGTDLTLGISAATELRPRPQVIVVLTDGFTPWPERAPERTQVVVGLLGSIGALLGEGGVRPPVWARTVEITAP